MPRRLRAQRLGEHRQPLAHRRGLVVDDVVDGRPVVLEREHGRRGGVVEVDPRPDAAAVADDRELPLADRLDRAVVGGAVEDAVAQRDPAELRDRLVRDGACAAAVCSRVGRAACGSSGSSSVLTGPPSRAYRPKPATLCATNRRTPASRAAASSASVPVVRSSFVRATVLSRLRLNFTFASAVASWTIASGSLSSTAFAHGPRVEQVEQHRLRAERPQAIGARGRVVGADHLVAGVDQLRDEPAADRAACSCDENTHRVLLPWLFVMATNGKGREGTATR